MLKILLFKPFDRVAGSKALGIGLVFLLFSAIVAYYSHTHFDGALDIHYGTEPTLVWSFVETLVAWLSMGLIFYLTGLLFSKTKIRFIDALGTSALARAPLLLAALLGFMMPHTVEGFPIINAPFIIGIFLNLVIVIWFIVLLFQAFKVSTNLKKNKLVLGFILSLLLAEALSLVSMYYLKPLF